jgi:hypothetical protein
VSESNTAMPSVVEGIALPGSPSSVAAIGAQTGAGAKLWQVARRVASFPTLMGVLLAGTSLVAVRLHLPDPDTWWHIAVGQRILDTHKWPTTDIYSFTAPGVHWIAYEWLGEVAMAAAAHAGGFLALTGLLIGMVAAITVLLYYYAYLRCGNWKAACVATGMLLPIATAIFSLRPQLFGYIFLLLTLICLERFRQGHSKALWFLPPLFLIWANTHGTFVFGLAAIGAYFAGGLFSFELGGMVAEPWSQRQRLQLLISFLLCTIAIVITPYGSEIAAYPAVMATSQPLNIANIQEWQPLSFSLTAGKYFLGLMLLLFAGHVFFPVKYRPQEMAMLLFGVYAACVHIRFILIFVMLLAPVLAGFFAKWLPRYDESKDRYGLNLFIIGLLVLSLVRFLPGKEEIAKVVARDYPVGAIAYLRAHPQPTGMFNEYGYGGYLIWQLGPQHKVFIDGRADMYEYSGVFQDYMHIANINSDTLSLLGKYGIQSCLISRKNSLVTVLAASPEWKQTYTDEFSTIFVRAHGLGHSGN